MATLRVPDVPDDLVAHLKARAAEAGMSLSAYVVSQLTVLTEAPTNADIVEGLRRRRSTAHMSVDEIAAAIRALADRR